MLVHSYLTNGFFNMAKVFLQSLHYVHGDEPPLVWLDTRGLKTHQAQELERCYVKDRIYINSMILPLRQWAERAEVSLKDMRAYKRQCEGRFVNDRNKVWKLMTAGDDRIHRLYDIMWPKVPPPDEPLNWLPFPDYIAHFDIDTLFRKPLTPVHALMKDTDLWLKLRPGHKIVKARITIDCILVRPTKGVMKFFTEWLRWINRTPPLDRPIGWGQASCWHAFERTKGAMLFDTLPLEWGLPGRNHPDDIVWTGNVHKLAKDDCVKLFAKEMKSWTT